MRDQAPRPELPQIPRYQMFSGHRLPHTRSEGSHAQAHQEDHPWHAVAADPAELLREVHRDKDAGGTR
jgi:hypothetical protein